MATSVDSILGSVLGAGRDDIVFKEIFSIIQMIGCGKGFRDFLSKIIAGIPRIMVLILIKHYISDPSILINFLKRVGWNFIKSSIYKVEEFSTTDGASLNYYIIQELKLLDPIEYVRMFPIYTSSTQLITKVEYVKGIHNKFISKLKDHAKEKLLKAQSTVSTTLYRWTSSYQVQEPCHFFPSLNYKRLESIIKSDVETSQLVKSFQVMGVLIDGEPGLGKSSFSEYIAAKNCVSHVYRVDMSTRQCLSSLDPSALFAAVFHNIPISAPSIFMIDEMDKYLDYIINASYAKLPPTIITQATDDIPETKSKIPFEEHSIKIRTDFLYSLLSILERSGLTKSCVVIFCSNNFDTIFSELDMTHFRSILDRFMRVKFEQCEKDEIIEYIKYYNDKFANTRFYNKNIKNIVSYLREDVSVTYRKLHQIAKRSSYDFEKMISLLNEKEEIISEVKSLKTVKSQHSYLCNYATKSGKQVIISASCDNTLKLWDLETGDCSRTYTGHTSEVTSLVLIETVDGKQQMISTSDDYTIKLWDLNTGVCLQTYTGHTRDTIKVVLTEPIDGKQCIVSVSADKTLKLWDLETGACLQTYTGHTQVVSSVVLTKPVDGKQLIISASHDRTLKLWNLESGACLQTYTGHTSRVWSVVLTKDNQQIVSAGDDGTIKLWDLVTGACVRTYVGHKDSVTSVVLTENNQQIVSSSSDKSIKLWDLATGACVRTYAGHTGIVTSVVLTGPVADKQKIISTSSDQSIKLWDLETEACLQTYTGHTGTVRSIVLTEPVAGERRMISVSDDDTPKLWDLTTGACLQTYTGHKDSVTSVILAKEQD